MIQGTKIIYSPERVPLLGEILDDPLLHSTGSTRPNTDRAISNPTGPATGTVSDLEPRTEYERPPPNSHFELDAALENPGATPDELVSQIRGTGLDDIKPIFQKIAQTESDGKLAELMSMELLCKQVASRVWPRDVGKEFTLVQVINGEKTTVKYKLADVGLFGTDTILGGGLAVLHFQPVDNDEALPLVIIPGSKANPGQYNALNTWMSNTHPTGFGASALNENRDGIDSGLKTFLDLVKRKNKGKKIRIAGHSLGGVLAEVTAAMAPSYFQDATLFNAPGMSHTVYKACMGVYQPPPQGPPIGRFETREDIVRSAGAKKIGAIFEVSMAGHDWRHRGYMFLQNFRGFHNFGIAQMPIGHALYDQDSSKLQDIIENHWQRAERATQAFNLRNLSFV